MLARPTRALAPLLIPALLAGMPAAAAIVEIDSVSGVFGNDVTNPGFEPGYGDTAGLGTSSINWGVSAGGSFNSSYAFAGQDVSTDGGLFVLGTFAHQNGYNWRRSADLLSVDLDIDIAGTLGGQAFSFDRKVSVVHDETHNEAETCGKGGENPCGDTVNFEGFDAFELVVDAGEFTYTMIIEAFFDTPTGDRVDDFFTAERDTNVAYIVGRVFTETDTEGEEPPPPAPVPLPATGLLLLGALGLVGAARRRR